MRTCEIDGCDVKHYALGLCSMHWHRKRKTGDPNKKWVKEPVGWYINNLGYRVGTLTDSNHMKLEHVRIAEKAYGGPLPEGAEVHHFDENPSNNTNNNLVVCQDRSYHKLLHCRRRAQLACGNPNWRPCVFCKEYDNPETMGKFNKPTGNTQQRYHHPQCRVDYTAKLKMRKSA